MTRFVELPSIRGRHLSRIFSLRGCLLLAEKAKTQAAPAFRQWLLEMTCGCAAPTGAPVNMQRELAAAFIAFAGVIGRADIPAEEREHLAAHYEAVERHLKTLQGTEARA